MLACRSCIWWGQAVPHLKKEIYGMNATSVHLFDDATLLKALFVVNLKMSSCFHEILEDYVRRKQPVSAFHTLKSFWPPWFCALASCSDVWSDFGAQHCAHVFLWIIFIGNKLFSFSWKWGDLLWVHFLHRPPLTHQLCAHITLWCPQMHIYAHAQISSLLNNAVRFINIKTGVLSQTYS